MVAPSPEIRELPVAGQAEVDGGVGWTDAPGASSRRPQNLLRGVNRFLSLQSSLLDEGWGGVAVKPFALADVGVCLFAGRDGHWIRPSPYRHSRSPARNDPVRRTGRPRPWTRAGFCRSCFRGTYPRTLPATGSTARRRERLMTALNTVSCVTASFGYDRRRFARKRGHPQWQCSSPLIHDSQLLDGSSL